MSHALTIQNVLEHSPSNRNCWNSATTTISTTEDETLKQRNSIKETFSSNKHHSLRLSPLSPFSQNHSSSITPIITPTTFSNNHSYQTHHRFVDYSPYFSSQNQIEKERGEAIKRWEEDQAEIKSHFEQREKEKSNLNNNNSSSYKLVNGGPHSQNSSSLLRTSIESILINSNHSSSSPSDEKRNQEEMTDERRRRSFQHLNVPPTDNQFPSFLSQNTRHSQHENEGEISQQLFEQLRLENEAHLASSTGRGEQRHPTNFIAPSESSLGLTSPSNSPFIEFGTSPTTTSPGSFSSQMPASPIQYQSFNQGVRGMNIHSGYPMAPISLPAAELMIENSPSGITIGQSQHPSSHPSMMNAQPLVGGHHHYPHHHHEMHSSPNAGFQSDQMSQGIPMNISSSSELSSSQTSLMGMPGYPHYSHHHHAATASQPDLLFPPVLMSQPSIHHPIQQTSIQSPVVSTSLYSNTPIQSPNRKRSQSKKSHARKRPPGHVKRPQNSFILYRTHIAKNNLIPERYQINKSQDKSRIIGMMWKSLTDEERKPWEEMSVKTHLEHAKLFPSYKYKPDVSSTKSSKNKRNNKHPDGITEKCEVIADIILKSQGNDGVKIAGDDLPRPSSSRGSKKVSKKNDSKVRSSTKTNSNRPNNRRAKTISTLRSPSSSRSHVRNNKGKGKQKEEGTNLLPIFGSFDDNTSYSSSYRTLNSDEDEDEPYQQPNLNLSARRRSSSLPITKHSFASTSFLRSGNVPQEVLRTSNSISTFLPGLDEESTIAAATAASMFESDVEFFAGWQEKIVEEAKSAAAANVATQQQHHSFPSARSFSADNVLSSALDQHFAFEICTDEQNQQERDGGQTTNDSSFEHGTHFLHHQDNENIRPHTTAACIEPVMEKKRPERLALIRSNLDGMPAYSPKSMILNTPLPIPPFTPREDEMQIEETYSSLTGSRDQTQLQQSSFSTTNQIQERPHTSYTFRQKLLGGGIGADSMLVSPTNETMDDHWRRISIQSSFIHQPQSATTASSSMLASMSPANTPNWQSNSFIGQRRRSKTSIPFDSSHASTSGLPSSLQSRLSISGASNSSFNMQTPTGFPPTPLTAKFNPSHNRFMSGTFNQTNLHSSPSQNQSGMESRRESLLSDTTTQESSQQQKQQQQQQPPASSP